MQLRQACREGNKVADWLTNFALELDLGMHEFSQPLCRVLGWLLQDVSGVYLSPAVRLIFFLCPPFHQKS